MLLTLFSMKNHDKALFPFILLQASLIVAGFTHAISFANEASNELTLKVDTEIGVVDNYLFQDTNEESSAYFSFSPSINVVTQFERQRFKLNAQSRHNKYNEFSIDDHTNFSIKPEYQYKIAPNKAIYLQGYFGHIFEYRGTGLSLGDASSLKKGDESELSDIAGGYTFGTEESVAKLDIAIGTSKRAYQTRRTFTKISDFNNQYIKASFDYLISGKTYLASDFGYESVEYAFNELLNKKKYASLIGVKWQSTEISQFSFLVGYQQIKFEESTFADNDAFKWRINFNWHPIYSTKINLSTERNFEETTKLVDSYRVVDTFQANVLSSFSDYLNANLTFGIKDENIHFIDSIDKEQYIFANIRLNYQRSERVSFFIKYQFDDLDASNLTYNYQRNSFSVGINVSI